MSPCELKPLGDLEARLELAALNADSKGVSAGRCLSSLHYLLPHADGRYPVVSIADLLAQQCAPDMARLQDCMMRALGLPVFILRAPERTNTAKVASLTFITLKHNHDAGFMLHEAQRAALAGSATPPPDEVVRDVLRAVRCGDPDAAVATLVAALGASAAARYLHVSEETVKARSATTLRNVRRYARVHADCLELECRLQGLTAEQATPALRMRALRRAHRALTPPTVTAFDVADTDADTPHAAAVREANAWIAKHCRPSETQSVAMPNGDLAPKLYQLKTRGELWRQYDAEHPDGLGRTSFLQKAFTINMSAAMPRGCLCGTCELGKEACETVTQLFNDPRLFAFLAAAVPAVTGRCDELKLRWARARTALRSTYWSAVKECVAADVLDSFDGSGNLTLADLPVVEGFDGLLDDILALLGCATTAATAVKASADVWAGELRAAYARVVEFRDHLQRWAWQDVREQQYIELARAAAADGRTVAIITIDFKEKLPETMRMRQVQSQYWQQTTVSMLCVHVKYWADGKLQHTCLDFVAEDTSQDGVWVAHAFAVLTKQLVALMSRIDGVIGLSDNASHFHGAMFFSTTLLDLARALRINMVVWNFYEAGEGKVRACCCVCQPTTAQAS